MLDKEFGTTGFIVSEDRKKEITYKIQEIQSIIQSCIDEECRFMGVDEEDANLIYLKRKGKLFTTWVGLLTEWLKILEPVKSFFVGAGIGAALLFFGNVLMTYIAELIKKMY